MQHPSVFALLLTASAGFTHLLSGQPASAQNQLLRLSNQLPATAPVTKGLDLWKARVEAATAGELKVEIYNNSQLYKDNEVFPAVQARTIDMGLVVSAQFTAFDPIFAVFDLPGVFRSYDQVSAALHAKTGALLTEHLHKLGVHPLYWPQQGFSAVATTKRTIAKPADFKRLKLRAHSRELARMFQLLGASPTVIAASEVSTAISRGTIDGLSTSLSSYASRKWFEDAPHLNQTPFGVVGTVVVINKALWDGLSAELKGKMEEASREAETFSTRGVVEDEAIIIKDLTAKGVKFLSFSGKEAAELASITRPMIEDYVSRAGPEGKEILDEVAGLKS